MTDRRSASQILERWSGRGASLVLAACALLLPGCGQESRAIGPDVPQTAPRAAEDSRAARYEGNVYQVAQGGRYFAWYGCGACHGRQASGPANLADGAWVHGGALNQVYHFIASGQPHGDGPYAPRIAAEQLW